MTSRIRFTKEKIEALPLPTASKRLTVYDSSIPKLALRITTAGSRTFYVVKRDGAAMAWVKLGAFPDMTVEQARRAAQSVLGDFARGVNPAQKKREEKQKMTLGAAWEQYWDLHVVPQRLRRNDQIESVWHRFLGVLPDAPTKENGRKREKHRAICP